MLDAPAAAYDWACVKELINNPCTASCFMTGKTTCHIMHGGLYIMNNDWTFEMAGL